jgi:hypothetical protein
LEVCNKKTAHQLNSVRQKFSNCGGLSFFLTLLIVSPMAIGKASNQPVISSENEYTKFTHLLDKLLAVPHSQIKAELDAEKRKKLTQKKRAAVGHSFRDAD